MNSVNLSVRVWGFVRDYYPGTYSLPDVTRRLLDHMRAEGHDADLIDGEHRNYKVVKIDGMRFRIIRRPGWSSYDVISTS